MPNGIDVTSLDLTTQTFDSVEATLNTQALWTMRVLDAALHAPYVDPLGTNADPSQGQLAATPGGGSWGVVTSCIGVTHAFDVAKTVDGLWLFGSNESTPAGVIWRSTDDGATWAESLSVPGGGFARFYAAAQFGDDILAFFSDTDATSFRMFRWTSGGTDWTEVDHVAAIVEAHCAHEFNGTPFWICGTSGKDHGFVASGDAVAITLDPADRVTVQASLPSVFILDATSDGTHAWLLDADHQVWRGDTAGNWAALFTVTDNTVRSIAVDTTGGFLYFGTTDSRILRTPIPA